MRGKSLVVLLSLAIFAGSTLSANAAQSTNTPGHDDVNPGGGRGNQEETVDRDRSEQEEGDGRRPCVTSSVYECPPPPPPRKKRTVAVKLPAHDDDCTCRPIPVKVNNQTQIVLDCYETKMFNGVQRTYVCKRPEIAPRIQ